MAGTSATQGLDLNALSQLHNGYYALRDSEPRDEVESTSISPRIARRTSNPTIREYDCLDKDGNTLFTIRRVLMDRATLQNNRDGAEENAFRQSLTELQQRNSHQDVLTNQVKECRNIILVDMIDPDSSDTSYVESHTICLWKTESKTIKFIDPSDVSKTSKKINEIINKIDSSLNADIERFGTNARKPARFYGPPNGLISTPECSTNDGDRRDCIDIAVKIAFVIAKEQNQFKSKTEVIESIKTLSNQKDMNPALGDACNGTLIRALQSSNDELRTGVFARLQSSKDILFKAISVHTFSDFETIENSKGSFIDTIRKLAGTMQRIKRVSIRQLEKISAFMVMLDEFNQSNLSIVKISLDAIFDVTDHIPQDGKDCNWTHFHLASMHKESIAELLKKLENSQFKNKPEELSRLISWPDIFGQTALHWAAGQGTLETCSLLYARMTPNQVCHQTERSRQTALHFAAQANKLDIVKSLLTDDNKARALAGIPDARGQTALFWAASKGYPDICSALYAKMEASEICIPRTDTGQTPLHVAVQGGDLNTVNALLGDDKARILVGIPDTWGQTALHWAAGEGYPDICLALCAKMSAAEILLTKGHGHTALHLAVHSNHVDVVEALLTMTNVKDQLISIKDTSGCTALQYAKSKNFSNICDILGSQ